MKTLRIQIRSVEQVLEDFRLAFEAAKEDKPFQKREGVFFTSLEAARNLLTPERVKLLRLIRQRRPASLYELAQLAGRDLKNVHEDIDLLERHGLLHTTLRRQLERPRRIPQVEYDEILLHIPLSVREKSPGYADEAPVPQRSQDFPDYARWRTMYRPERIRWVFVAESPPSDPARYFYFEHVSRGDSLFLEMMKALYPSQFTTAREVRANKPTFLNRFKNDGCFLLDAVEYPLGDLGPTGKKRKLREALPGLVNGLRALNAETSRIVLISAPVHTVCAFPLRRAGFAVLNTEPIDFPGSGRQRQFRRKMKELLLRNGWPYAAA